MPPVPRLKRQIPQFERELPDEACLRCGAVAAAGYVTASAGRGRANLGWITGAPTWRRWRDVLIDSRYLNKPARWAGYRCSACGLVMLELYSPESP